MTTDDLSRIRASCHLVLIDDPNVDPLRGFRRFEAIVRGVGLHIPPAAAEH